MGRLVALVALVAGAGIAIVAVNGPGKDKLVVDVLAPHRESTRVSYVASNGQVVTPGQPAAARAPLGATVVMRRLAFTPTSVTVHAGQAIRWVNHDNVAHTVFQDVGARSGELPLFESERILPGRSFTYVVHTPGTIAYVCTLHPSVMSARIVVLPAQSA